jgi:hypothetical protein
VNRKGYFVTVSLIGLLVLLFSFSTLLHKSDQIAAQQFSASKGAEKIAEAEEDLGQSLTVLYGLNFSTAYNSTNENTTFGQSPPANASVLSSFRSFVNSTLSDFMGVSLSLAPDPSTALLNMTDGAGVSYYYGSPISGGITANGSSTNITWFYITVTSNTTTDATTNWNFNPAGDVLVHLDYTDPSGTKTYDGRLFGSSVGNTFSAYDSSNPAQHYFTIVLGKVNGVNDALQLSSGGMAAAWNVTVSRPLASSSLSRWHYSEVLSTTVAGLGLSTRVPAVPLSGS